MSSLKPYIVEARPGPDNRKKKTRSKQIQQPSQQPTASSRTSLFILIFIQYCDTAADVFQAAKWPTIEIH